MRIDFDDEAIDACYITDAIVGDYSDYISYLENDRIVIELIL